MCSDLHTFPHHPRFTVLSAKQAVYYTALIVTIKVIHQMVQCVDVYVSHAFILRFTFGWQPIHLNLITYCSSFPKQIDWWSSRVCFVNYNVQHAQKPKTLYFFFFCWAINFFFFVSSFQCLKQSTKHISHCSYGNQSFWHTSITIPPPSPPQHSVFRKRQPAASHTNIIDISAEFSQTLKYGVEGGRKCFLTFLACLPKNTMK